MNETRCLQCETGERQGAVGGCLLPLPITACLPTLKRSAAGCLLACMAPQLRPVLHLLVTMQHPPVLLQ